MSAGLAAETGCTMCRFRAAISARIIIAAILLALVAAAVFSSQTLANAAGPPTISSTTVEPVRATVGDRITLTIVVDHDGATTVEGPGFGADAGEFEIVAVTPPHTEARGGASRTTLVYTLTAFRTGEMTVPPQPIAYRGPDGNGAIATSGATVTIASVLAPGETELRPLKPQLSLEDPAPPPAVPALFVAAFAAMTALGYILVRRATAIPPPAPVTATPAEAPLIPHDTARTALDALAISDLATADVAEYYARMAATIRTYLSARFTFPAYAMTRSELEREMAGAGIDRWPARLTANLLEQCDAVEFAAFRPAPERLESDLTAAYEIIELTAGAE